MINNNNYNSWPSDSRRPFDAFPAPGEESSSLQVCLVPIVPTRCSDDNFSIIILMRRSQNNGIKGNRRPWSKMQQVASKS